jgi:hypothetical protein
MIKNENIKPYVKTMLQMIKDGGGKEIRVSFDGSGDSGSVESAEIYNGDKNLNMLFSVDYLEVSSNWSKDGGWVKTESVKRMPVKEALEAFCYDLLENTGIDWYNNDGGYGELRITLDPVEIQLEVNTRYTEVNSDEFVLDEQFELKD